MNKTSRRELFKLSSKASAACATSVWLTPSILSVAVPSHAQASLQATTTLVTRVCADRLSDTVEIPLTETDYTRTVNFAQYDPIDGIISEAVLNYRLVVQSDVDLENTEGHPQSITIVSAADVQITLPDDKKIKVTPSSTRTVELEADDGTLDFTGPSGTRISEIRSIVEGSLDLIAEGVDMSFFTGTGKVSLPVQVLASSERSRSSGNVIMGIETYASATLTINYACELT